MKVCSTCQHEQPSGNFCGKCGGKLTDLIIETEEIAVQNDPVIEKEEAATLVVDTPTPPVEEPVPTQETKTTVAATEQVKEDPSITNQMKQKLQQTNENEQIQKVKSESKAYLNYLKSSLKSPTAEIGDAKNSYINIGLFILLTTINLYLFANNTIGSWGFGPSFLDIFSAGAVTMLVLLIINALSIFITTKLFTKSFDFTYVIKKLGNYYTIVLVGAAVSLVLLLIKSNNAGLLVTSVSISIAFFFIPLFVLTQTLLKYTVKNDSFYAFLVYLLISVILTSIATFTILDSFIGSLDDVFRF